MKKTLLSIFCALFCLCAAAQSEKTYNEQYVVTTNGIAAEPQDATITVVDNGDGTINFVIKDFIAKLGGNETPVGDISLNNVPAQTDENGVTYFNQEGTFDIPLDNMPPEFEPFAQAGYFNDVPYTLQGKLNDEKLYASLEIDMSRMGQNISVEVGTDDFGTTPEPEGKVYTEPLVITINGESTEPQDASVTVVDNGDGTINFVLNNFFLGAGENSIPVGNIRIDNLPVTVGEDGLTYISYDGPLTIQPGNMEGMSDTDWLGPMIGEIPLALQGKMNDEKLFVTIDIDLQALLGQIVYVQLGTDDFGTTPEPEGKVYTEPLVVTVNGESTEPQDASVIVIDNGDGTINFVLNNFFLGAGENSIPVGNIRIDNLPVTVGEDGLTYISYDGPLTIQPGNMEGMSDTDWLGPMLGEIPVVLNGKMNDEKLFVTIDIDLQALLGQNVYVQLGTDDFFPVVLTGDANEDGEVDVADATFILNVMADEADEPKADVNGDGEVDVADYTYVLNLMADE